jgi:DtxR family Mn-dependent transcriptional regulator
LALVDFSYLDIVLGMPEESLAKVTSLPELLATTEAEQMYLITVARETEAGAEGPVPISRIAEILAVSVPSANEMIRKLDTRGLLTYEPYHGVRLSSAGERIAGQVLRTRRLWATFLAEHLGFSPAEADEQACHLEHATTPDAANRLSAFLGNPVAGPLGRPIPEAIVLAAPQPHVRLTEVRVGSEAEVVAVSGSESVSRFLAAEGIVGGEKVSVLAAGSSGILVDHRGGCIHLDPRVAESIQVRAIGEDRA